MKRTNRTLERVTLLAAIAITAGLCYLNAVSLGQATDEGVKVVRPVAGKLSAAEARIHAALEEPARVEFQEVPLRDAVLYLGELHDIDIVLDTRALEDVGIGNDQPVSLVAENVRLRSVLALMLRPLELTWVVRDDVLLITTQEVAESALVSHVYEVRDLMQSRHGGTLDPVMLIDLITTAVEPAAWDEVGGVGSLAAFNGTLIVSQTDPVHRQVQSLLTELRRAKHALQHNPRKAFETRWNVSLDANREAQLKIEAALDQPTEGHEFVDVPLSEVIAVLEQEAGIPIEFDWFGLADAGIDGSTPVTVKLTASPLRSALNRVLRQFDLVANVRHEVLLISSQEGAEANLSSSVFVVRDLFQSPLTADDDAMELMQLITTTVAPDRWAEVGGAGSIAHFPLIDGLVVSQTDEVLDEVEALLAKLREVGEARQPWSAEEWEAQRQELLATPQFQVFVIQQEPTGQLSVDPQTVVQFLQKSVDQQLLTGSHLKVTQSSITMFLTPPEAERVDALLRKAKLPVSRRLPNSMFPGGFGGGGFSGGGFGGGGGGIF